MYYFERALAVTGRHRAFSTDDPRMAPVKPFTDEIREAYAYNQIGLAYKARRHPHQPRTADIQATYLPRHRAALSDGLASSCMALSVVCCCWLQGMGMVKEAEQAFLRGLEHEPDMYELVANMGVLLLDAYVHTPQTGLASPRPPRHTQLHASDWYDLTPPPRRRAVAGWCGGAGTSWTWPSCGWSGPWP